MKHIFDLNTYDLSLEQIKKLFGTDDSNMHRIENYFQVSIFGNGDKLFIESKEEDNISKVCKSLEWMIKYIKKEKDIDKMSIDRIFQQAKDNQYFEDEGIKFVTTYQKRVIKPKNESQLRYFKLLEKNTIIFALGAAGTGKTFLAVAYAVEQLKKNKIQKIIITRPIVEAGENLGFLPGELKEKVDPYLTPIYDALNTFLSGEVVQKYIEKGMIEIAPLAYMRGRTLSDAIIILDEAQNTTTTQMKMFLTRLGYNAKMIITGDESQVDLKKSERIKEYICSYLHKKFVSIFSKTVLLYSFLTSDFDKI